MCEIHRLICNGDGDVFCGTARLHVSQQVAADLMRLEIAAGSVHNVSHSGDSCGSQCRLLFTCMAPWLTPVCTLTPFTKHHSSQ